MATSGTTPKKYPTPDSDAEPKKMASRKRRASEMEGPRAKKATDAIDTPPGLSVSCPATLKRGKPGATSDDEDMFIGSDAPKVPLGPPVITYGVTPGKMWEGMTVYKRAAFPVAGVSDKETPKYTSGDIVYINRHYPVPALPPEDCTFEERLQFDKENYWVGMISEIRAENNESVYIRLFWLYWPEELSMGRQEYHGSRELVLSNHVDIVEAQCIAYHADVSFWDETDDSNLTSVKDRYWRQTLDLTKLARDPRGALSKLRRFCICGGYDHPDGNLYQCGRADCNTWNHDKCLVQHLEERAWEKFKAGVLGHEQPSDTANDNDVPNGHVVNKKVDTKKATKKRPWTRKLEAKITKGPTVDGQETHIATVTQLVPTPTSSTSAKFQPMTWNMNLKCLKCDHPFD